MIRAYLDSCMVISLIEGSTIQQQLLRQNLVRRSVFSSELTRLEVQITPIRKSDQNSLKRFAEFFTNCKNPEFNRSVFDQAIQLRVKSKLKTPDALHLAAVIVVDCKGFWAEDRQLKSIASQPVSNCC